MWIRLTDSPHITEILLLHQEMKINQPIKGGWWKLRREKKKKKKNKFLLYFFNAKKTIVNATNFCIMYCIATFLSWLSIACGSRFSQTPLSPNYFIFMGYYGNGQIDPPHPSFPESPVQKSWICPWRGWVNYCTWGGRGGKGVEQTCVWEGLFLMQQISMDKCYGI